MTIKLEELICSVLAIGRLRAVNVLDPAVMDFGKSQSQTEGLYHDK